MLHMVTVHPAASRRGKRWDRLREHWTEAELHVVGEPDHLRAMVTFLTGPHRSGEVFKLVLHLEAHGHFALFLLWGDLDENPHLVGFSKGNNAARQKTKGSWVSQALKQLF